MAKWLEIGTPQGTQHVRADQVVGIMPVCDQSGVPSLGHAALLIQGMPAPVVVAMNPARVLSEIESGDGPALKLTTPFPAGKP